MTSRSRFLLQNVDFDGNEEIDAHIIAVQAHAVEVVEWKAFSLDVDGPAAAFQNGLELLDGDLRSSRVTEIPYLGLVDDGHRNVFENEDEARLNKTPGTCRAPRLDHGPEVDPVETPARAVEAVAVPAAVAVVALVVVAEVVFRSVSGPAIFGFAVITFAVRVSLSISMPSDGVGHLRGGLLALAGFVHRRERLRVAEIDPSDPARRFVSKVNIYCFEFVR